MSCHRRVRDLLSLQRGRVLCDDPENSATSRLVATVTAVRAVVVETFGEPPRVADVPDPRPPAHGVVVAVAATGVCRSDWHAWRGHDPDVTLPHVPGHELAGARAPGRAGGRRGGPRGGPPTPLGPPRRPPP